MATQIDSLEKLSLPGEGARFDISISAKNAARSSVVSVQHSIEECMELCLADAMDAVAKYERENPERTGFLTSAHQMMAMEVAASSDPGYLDFSKRLWPELTEHPSMDRSFTGPGLPLVNSEEEAGLDFLNTPFWHDWYWGIVSGKPLDWDLQRRISLIDDAVWDAGPEAVAAEIERIRAEFSAPRAGKERFPKHEPKSVSHLIENRIISSASLQGLAAQVIHSIDRFHAETGANALPDALEPLTALPALLLAVTSAIQNAPSSETIASETEDQLRAEVGRLNAKVAELEGKISGLEAVIASLPKSEHKGILHLLAQTALWGSLAGGLWMLSGEDADLRKRYESLIERKEQIRGLLMREGLPQTQVEKSLRPAARPGRA
ncbi:hypothetical protein [Leisingera sp. M523]|uniref:hypothetical protein n=1 Tax=Leisingera sp. M523 TaxID=2867013 RepID=UPI0021A512AC|nr:hypothetical protein [Leisingera sp. M523]UWQ29835.1 hypothetical protein K3557_04585 [Leisingera sp. M523]